MKEQNKFTASGIGIITKPIGNAGLVPLSNLIRAIYPISNILHIITGGKGNELKAGANSCIIFSEIHYPITSYMSSKIIKHIDIELSILAHIIKSSKDISIWIFFLDSHIYLMPVLAAKLQRKKVIFALAASIKNSAKAQNNSLLNILVYSEAIANRISDRIVLYSPNIIEEWGLQKYKNKISIAHEHIIDTKKFHKLYDIYIRPNIIGYIGRLSEEKGVLNFIQAIPLVLNKINNIKFAIGGEGHLIGTIKSFLNNNALSDNVELLGWISHNDLPGYLNRIKLLVLPSYSEGLPNIMLEAMACGTPVLAASVGAIPDFIKDGENGFLMSNNSPKSIASNIIRAIKNLDLENISIRAQKNIENEFVFERTAEGWRMVLLEVNNSKK